MALLIDQTIIKKQCCLLFQEVCIQHIIKDQQIDMDNSASSIIQVQLVGH